MTENCCGWIILGSVIVFCAFGFVGAPLLLWTAAVAGLLFACQAPVWLWAVFGVIAVIFNLRPLRKALVTSVLFQVIKKLQLIPALSDTERTALKAGEPWIEGELFSGKPNLKRIVTEAYPDLTAEEKAFVDNQVKTVCSMMTDWQATQLRDLPPEVWAYLKKERFLGMVIPKEYGGLGFSALAHSEVLCMLASRSLPLCITVMVPNSLGPAELLNHYGTPEQKKHFLPRLAVGDEIPCFALTEPGAGSDAGSITSSGEVFKGDDGKLYLKLNWNKRWITLAAASTIIGLAFKLRDPKNLLGKGEDIGITCALIPSKTPGVKADRRHDPLSVPFYNCPTQGKDVVVPIDAIIGGVEWAGKGWQMLMESLAAGRGISLPAQTTGGGKFVALVASAHATVRKQFGMSIGKFEGISEPLARLTGFAYLMEGARKFTLGALDKGFKPPVITAMAKYNFTELARKMANDAMDIQGGAGISRGPSNLLATNYTSTPIAITVEGANIMTRTLIIFGQGAMMAHPYAAKEVAAMEAGDIDALDRELWGHIGSVIRNFFRSVFLSLTRGRLACSPVSGPSAKYWRKLAWSSATFALLADLAMGSLAAKLKFKEKITGRFADALSWQYLACGALRRFEAEGRPKEDLPILDWVMRYSFTQVTQAFDGIYKNFEAPGLTWLFRGPLWLYSRFNPISTPGGDALENQLAALAQVPGPQRDRLFGGGYMPTDIVNEPLARLEHAFRLSIQSELASGKVRKALKAKKLSKKAPAELYKDALSAGVIAQAEYDSIAQAETARWAAIQVDDFGLEEYKNRL
jgi:acyl-CoA dehydrogenase